jgi:ABC-2 type transport system permease protein
MQMFDDNEVLDITSLLYDQNNLSKIVIDEEAVCVVIIPKGFEKMVLTKRYPIVIIVNTSNVLTANMLLLLCKFALGR